MIDANDTLEDLGMNITTATQRYENWLRASLPADAALDEEAIEFKHDAMRARAFPFLRATFYRWAQLWRQEAGALAQAPEVLSVGDLHVENFGTWQDEHKRWVWGVNDFDEAWELPWTSDLVRLGVSASLASKAEGVEIATSDLCEFLLAGYQAGLEKTAGAPFDLNDGHERLRLLAEKTTKSEDDFWAGFDTADSKWQPTDEVPEGARRAFEKVLPKGAKDLEYRQQRGPYEAGVRKPSGLGSLGRQRYCVLFRQGKKRQVREAKVALPSAVTWAGNLPGGEIKIAKLLAHARRFPDPYFTIEGSWAARRIAPDAVKIGFNKLNRNGIEPADLKKLFTAMGCETANIHLGSPQHSKVLKDLEKRNGHADWYLQAVRSWRERVKDDWEAFARA